jgi:transcriptional regulator with XRE-family HTH domain
MLQQSTGKDVGRRLRDIRNSRGLSLESVAAKASLEPEELALIESGDYKRFDPALLSVLAKVFDVRPVTLLVDEKTCPSREELAQRNRTLRMELLQQLSAEARRAVAEDESSKGREVGNDVLRILAEFSAGPTALNVDWMKLLRSVLGYAGT